MIITELKINHLTNPIGYDMEFQTFSWKWSGQVQGETPDFRVIAAKDLKFCEILYDSGYTQELTGAGCECRLRLEPRTRYYWKVMAREGDGRETVSETAFFETGKQQEEWNGKWIGMPDAKTGKAGPAVRKEFVLEEAADRARLYVTGTGLYECFVNGQLVNDGYLQPGFNHYNFWQQVQSFDVTPFLRRGKNVISFLMGDGWYRGRFGVNGGMQNNFGTGLHLLMELHSFQKDGTEQMIVSDESFRYTEGPVQFSNIYDGEIYDARVLPDVWMYPEYSDAAWKHAVFMEPERMEKLADRFSLPVKAMEKRRPVSLDKAPDGTMILDMGQNMTGWLVFRDMLPCGGRICFQFAELLEDGKLCRKNLLTAKQEFIYTSDGKGKLVRPHFTYYGFRYVQISGFPEDIEKDCFTGWCLYSSMPVTMKAETGNQKINQLLSNVMWSQKDNFLEHPSDCPQRAERLGWTGDAQIYCRTASFNMETSFFFRKYMKDVNEEQRHKNGMVPFIIPKIAGKGFENPAEDECSAAWSDVAVIIPWNQYVFFGDKNILREEYPGMKAWVEYMHRKDVEDGGKALWNTGFQFGDWLALDNPEPGPFGKTDPGYIASCYYHYSSLLTSKAAKVLGMEEDAVVYEQMAERIKTAIQKKYFDEKGIFKQGTQTGYVMAIFLELVPEEAIRENGRLLAEKIQKNGNHLDTGFVGTPYLLPALSRAGLVSTAYDLLLQEEYPGWLYEVNLGATTIWEAWDALDSDGRLTGEMSLNHYAFGSVAEWIYTECCGIRPMESFPGFRKIRIEPRPDKRLDRASAEYSSAAGTYYVEWKYLSENQVRVRISVPDGAAAYFKMPGDAQAQELKSGKYEKFFAV